MHLYCISYTVKCSGDIISRDVLVSEFFTLELRDILYPPQMSSLKDRLDPRPESTQEDSSHKPAPSSEDAEAAGLLSSLNINKDGKAEEPKETESKEVKESKEEPKEEKKEEPKEEPKEEKDETKKEEKTDTKEDSNLIKSTYEVQVKLKDLQADPNSPLYSAKSFEDLGLSEELLKGLYAMKYSKPSKIQEKALPLLLSNPPQNMIGQSQSGTGKTAAFVLNMLSRVDTNENSPQALCLSPSRELARQTMDVINEMGKYTKVTTGFAIPEAVPKGQSINSQVIVGTPGTVMDLIRRKQLQVSKIKVFVLDEADNMLDQQGLGSQCSRVKKTLPKDCQLVLFSATFPKTVYDYALSFVPDANEIRLKAEELNVDQIKQLYIDCDSREDKITKLMDIYSLLTIGSSMIFTQTKATADDLYKKLSAEGHKVSVLHGNLDNSERDRLMDEFRDGKSKVLITTNVIARGIDIPSVTMVVNFDVPLDGQGRPDPSTYLHRIGRTGRFGRQGVSITFVHDKESYKQFQLIVSSFKEGITVTHVKTDDPEELEEIVTQALKA